MAATLQIAYEAVLVEDRAEFGQEETVGGVAQVSIRQPVSIAGQI
jgi:hypothetical protein